MQNKKGFKRLDFVVFDTISHINKYYKLYSIKIVFPNIHTFGKVPTADPELS